MGPVLVPMKLAMIIRSDRTAFEWPDFFLSHSPTLSVTTHYFWMLMARCRRCATLIWL